MRIAYIGKEEGTSLHRAKAFQRLGHEVVHIDPWRWLAKPDWSSRLYYHTGYLGIGWLVDDRLFRETEAARPDLIWVNQGEFLDRDTIKRLRELQVNIVNYANDNPFSLENHKRFARYKSAIPFYDLIVVVFSEAVAAANKLGARQVLRKYISADEVAHRDCLYSDCIDPNCASEVAFVGTWLRGGRGSFVAELIQRGVPLSIWGDNWQKSPEWDVIRNHWRGPGVYEDEGYARLLRSAKICLGLLNNSSGNLHTDRSIQIPALGALLCTERTSEHAEMYEEGKEAVFWSDASECADLCKALLVDTPRRRAIAARGHARALQNNLFNEPVLSSILEELFRE